VAISFGGSQRFRRRRSRVEAVVDRLQLGLRLGRAGEQFVVRLRPEAALCLGDAVETRLDLFEASRLGLECRQESTELARRLPQPQLDAAQLIAGAG
jgi:hypothetical protein